MIKTSSYRIAFVIPYIGKLPDTFPFWLKTCEYNSFIDFLLFTDDETAYNYPDNVKVTYVNFGELQEKFQSHFDFPIALTKPYKFCDFRPAYGEIFQEELVGYDFWGHCDIDLFWGDLRKFVTEDMLGFYDRIYTHGHCCLYRNTDRVNRWYRTLAYGNRQNWKHVFQNPDSRCFDEWGGHCGGGISHILEDNGIISYDRKDDFADLNFRKGAFSFRLGQEVVRGKNIAFVIGADGCFALDKGVKIAEFAYVHCQKRK